MCLIRPFRRSYDHEEANEFVQRFTSGELKERPMFTSCCPGMAPLYQVPVPASVKQLSTAKSPQQMFGAVMRLISQKSLVWRRRRSILCLLCRA